MLTEWRISHQGSSVNGVPAADTSIGMLHLAYNQPISIRFEVKEDAANMRGLNLFGSQFGDHPQDIVLEFIRRGGDS
ncbi:hypothetical protein D3C81_1882330 [compost metagenome]